MLTCRQVINKPLITSDGRILGKVESVIVDDAWKIPLFSIYLERAVAEKFHIRRPLLGNPRSFLEPSEISALSDNVILKRRLVDMKEQLRERGQGVDASRLLGRKVSGEEGYYFGDLEDMTIDQARWRVLELVVEVKKKAADEMGFPMTLFGTCKAKVPVKRVEAVKDHIVLSIGPEDFKEYVVKERSRE
jgi:sporulation protein YlmC with PRC-barrel domain